MINNLRSTTVIKQCISPQAVSDNTAAVSTIIDTAGFTYVEFGILAGTLADADATFAVLVEDGDESDLSDNAAVADANLEGTEADAGFQFDDDDEVRRIGYRPQKRYARITITPSANASAANIAAFALLAGAQQLPITQPDS